MFGISRSKDVQKDSVPIELAPEYRTVLDDIRDLLVECGTDFYAEARNYNFFANRQTREGDFELVSEYGRPRDIVTPQGLVHITNHGYAQSTDTPKRFWQRFVAAGVYDIVGLKIEPLYGIGAHVRLRTNDAQDGCLPLWEASSTVTFRKNPRIIFP